MPRLNLSRQPPAVRWAFARRGLWCAFMLAGIGTSSWTSIAQASSALQPPTALTLSQAFEAAWARQPEAVSAALHQDAARAQQEAASAWTAAPATLEALYKGDRGQPGRGGGARELEVGIALPLWLPGERDAQQRVAAAQARAAQSRVAEAQLKLAASVREAWWRGQRSRVALESAADQVESASAIAADVALRVQAGELARADAHQADAALAAAQAALAQAQAEHTAAQLQLGALTGQPAGQSHAPSVASTAPSVAEPEPPADTLPPAQTHPQLNALLDRQAVAQSEAALAGAQTRANPELILSTTRERGAATEPYRQSFALGLRMPFGGGPRHDARVATAQAQALEWEAQAALERSRLSQERVAVRARVEAARSQLAAAQRRASLARETRGFFGKSFDAGQSDLPNLLRVQAEAVDAERQAALAHIALGEAISAWRQALGLLPP